jgi:hypothetical protein
MSKATWNTAPGNRAPNFKCSTVPGKVKPGGHPDLLRQALDDLKS